MKRSAFVKSTALLLIDPLRSSSLMEENMKMRVPPLLKPGDTIGICSPAGYISAGKIEPCIRMMEEWGFKVKLGNSVGQQWNIFGGTDEQRIADFQDMLNDTSVAAIMCARGGYGMVRIIDRIDFSVLRKQPKWIMGFSDITVLHAHLNRKLRVASIHSKMCNSFPDPGELLTDEQAFSLLSIKENLTGTGNYSFPATASNRLGEVEAELVGGNLKTIESLSGTASDIKTDGKILFVEDTGEYLYSIDRMFWNLLRTGKLSKLKGLMIGGMKIRPDDPGEEFGMTVEEIVLEKLQEFDYPVAFGLPVGHQKYNVAVKCGARYRLSVNNTQTLLSEIP
jgi:muramoyltetrapeptide carboxypeptidase